LDARQSFNEIMRTTSSDLLTDNEEIVHIQGPIRRKAVFKKVVIPKAKIVPDTPNFQCSIKGCKLDAHDKCAVVGCLCEGTLEFCKEHLEYKIHQKLLFN